MLGAWPIEADCLKQYVTKALREGKTHTSWINTEDFQRGVLRFVDSLYANDAFLKKLLSIPDHNRVLGHTFLHFTACAQNHRPGITDFYRGSDIWDLSLADPDNRRHVGFSSRIKILEELTKHSNLRELLQRWIDGRLKLYVTWKLLNFPS